MDARQSQSMCSITGSHPMSSARRSADTGPRVCANRDSPMAALRTAIRLNPSMYPPMMPSNNSSDWTAGISVIRSGSFMIHPLQYPGETFGTTMGTPRCSRTSTSIS